MKKTYIISITIFLLSGGMVALFAQETNLLPTGRSLPDVVPTNEFIYVAPVDTTDPNTDYLSPSKEPIPSYDPIPPSKSSIGEFPKESIGSMEPLVPVDTNPPISNASVPPSGIGNYPTGNPTLTPGSNPKITKLPTAIPGPNEGTPDNIPNNPPPSDIANVPPTGQIPPGGTALQPKDAVGPLGTVGPSGDAAFAPDGEIGPSGQVAVAPDEAIGPSDQVAVAPDGAIGPSGQIAVAPDGEIGPSGQIAVAPDGSIGPSGTVAFAPDGSASPLGAVPPNRSAPVEKNLGWKLVPTGNSYPKDKEKRKETPKTLTKPTLVVGTTQEQITQEPIEVQVKSTDVRVIGSLNGQRYIQIVSYKERDLAEKKLIALSADALDIAKKLAIYKADDSKIYKLVIGPFSVSEIGVHLYRARQLGFKDAFTIQ